jgi:hypothetical protein
VHVPLNSNVGAHVTLLISSRVNRFCVLVSEFSKVQLEFLQRITLVQQLNELARENKISQGNNTTSFSCQRNQTRKNSSKTFLTISCG